MRSDDSLLVAVATAILRVAVVDQEALRTRPAQRSGGWVFAAEAASVVRIVRAATTDASSPPVGFAKETVSIETSPPCGVYGTHSSFD